MRSSSSGKIKKPGKSVSNVLHHLNTVRIVKTTTVTISNATCFVAFYHMWKDVSDKSVETFKTPHGSLMSIFHLTVGEFEVRFLPLNNL